MNWSRNDGPRGYHHGNLKEALIRAALELIAKKGPGGFTFAEAARFAGVSPAAPYRHFRDREALLADVAREGFARFEAMLATGWANGKPDPITAFHNVGSAYLAFARSEPAYYAAMFESGLPPDLNPELRAASDRAFGVLRTAADALENTFFGGGQPRILIRFVFANSNNAIQHFRMQVIRNKTCPKALYRVRAGSATTYNCRQFRLNCKYFYIGKMFFQHLAHAGNMAASAHACN